VACQFDFLRRCLPPGIRRALDELPKTLDETYQRALEDIGEAKWKYAHRLFQCMTVASRPFRVKELAEFLVFDFEAGQIPTLLEGWRAEDPREVVLSTCSSLIAVIEIDDCQVVQFSHFSVKEFLMSSRLAMESPTISRYHVLLTPSHTMVAQACLGTLIHLGGNVGEDRLKGFPLASYAAQNWVDHAQFDNVSQIVQRGIKLLFDPSMPHFMAWVRLFDSEGLFDPDAPWYLQRSERAPQPPGTPLHFAALYGLSDVVEFLIVERAQDVKARRCSDNRTPLFTASERGHADVARILLRRRAAANDHDKNGDTPLHLATEGGHLEVVRNLLGHRADINSRDKNNLTPLHLASRNGDRDITQLLLENGADANAHDNDNATPLHWASEEKQLGVVRILLDHGADANSRDNSNLTPLHLASQNGYVNLSRHLLERGADPNARDIDNMTPLHWASEEEHLEVVLTLLGHGADANARGKDNQTPLHMALRCGHR
jgi:ankyrin repeat protein